jgi:hypothetical protein
MAAARVATALRCVAVAQPRANTLEQVASGSVYAQAQQQLPAQPVSVQHAALFGRLALGEGREGRAGRGEIEDR